MPHGSIITVSQTFSLPLCPHNFYRRSRRNACRTTLPNVPSCPGPTSTIIRASKINSQGQALSNIRHLQRHVGCVIRPSSWSIGCLANAKLKQS